MGIVRYTLKVRGYMSTIEKNVMLTHTKYGCVDMRYEPFRPDVLKILRSEKGITQKVLSEGAGIPLITIKKIESGVYKPSLETLQILGKFFNLYLYAEWEKEESPD